MRGDPLCTVRDLKEVGVSSLFNLPADLRLEAGFTGIFVEGRFVHTEKLYISWDKGFPIFKNL
jgi:hypothetical protein